MSASELMEALRSAGIEVANPETPNWFELGRNCEYKMGNIPLAERCYLQGANQGDAECMFFLAGLFEKGYEASCVSEDDAACWLQKAAEKGHVRSMTLLGYWLCVYTGYNFLKGQTVREVAALALRLLTDAAETGDAEAQYYLGREYARGLIVKESYEDAVKWLLRSSLNGSGTALLYRGDYCYQAGNFSEAFHAYDRACEIVNASGFEGERLFSEEPTLEDDGQVEYRLAYLYKHGLGVEEDLARADELQKIAETKSYPRLDLLDPRLFAEDIQIARSCRPWYDCETEYLTWCNSMQSRV